MRVTVIAPESAVFDGEADSVVVPAFDGELGILNHHAPLMTVLGQGELRVTSAGSTRRFHVQGGFVQVVRNTVRILAERVDNATNA